MRHNHWPLTMLVVLTVVSTVGVRAVRAEPPSADLDGYHERVRPLLERYCFECHSDDVSEGGLSLSSIDGDLLRGPDYETWRMVSEQVGFHDMPPKDSTQPSTKERNRIADWIRGELLKTQTAGVATNEKLLLAEFGNHVDHHALFDQRRSHVTPAPPRIWRLRPAIYDTVAPRLADRVSGLANALNARDGSDFKDYSTPYFLDEASTQQLFSNAKKIADNQLASHGKDKAIKRLVADDSAPNAQDVQAAIEVAFRRALLRGPSDEERSRLLKLHEDSVRIGGRLPAARALLVAILMKPEFLFRQELGDGSIDSHGRTRLTPRETAFAFSFALSNQPLSEFLTAASSDQLSKREDLIQVLRTRLEDDSPSLSKNPRILQFFREYFHYPFASEVFKDAPLGGEHNPHSLIADLEMTIIQTLKEDRHVLRKLLTTREYYVNASYGRKKEANRIVRRNSKSRKYQTAFSLPLDWKWSIHLQPVVFRSDERAGVLTHPAWLTAWSGNFENHPVQRGRWIRTHLLGGSVPDVPIGVDARVPEMDNATFRERLKIATGASECWRCHRKMDPLGVAFEQFDHYGRVQRLDNGRPVDASCEVSRTPFPELHRKFSGPTEMLDVLAKSPRVEQVFVRHVFRFVMGRNETLGDANTLQDAHRTYQESDRLGSQ